MPARTPDTKEPSVTTMLALNRAEVDQMCRYLIAWGRPLIGVAPQKAYIDTAKDGAILLASLAQKDLLLPHSPHDLAIVPQGSDLAYRMHFPHLLPQLINQPAPDMTEAINATIPHLEQLRQLWYKLSPTFERLQWVYSNAPDVSLIYRAGANLVTSIYDRTLSEGYNQSNPIQVTWSTGGTIHGLKSPTRIVLDKGQLRTTQTTP